MDEVSSALQRHGNSAAYLLSFAVCLLVICFVAWAHYAVLDEVTRGSGQVIPSRHVQVIQHLEGGILEEVMVRENQIVQPGDILVRLSNEQAASHYRDSFSQSMEHRASIARLEAEVNEQELSLPAEIARHDPQIVMDQKQIYAARKEQLQLELNILNSQYQQKMQEIGGMESKKDQLGKNLELAREQVAIATPLVEKKLFPKVEYLSLEREINSITGEIQSLELNIPRAVEAAQEIKRRQAQRRAEFKSTAAAELNKKRGELKSLLEANVAGQDRATRTDVRSPVRGTVKKIYINTLGGVVKPGESILEIIPLDETLLIEAKIRPADIAFLHPGQKSMVKITAYDYGIYGGLEGFVEQISADTIEDDRREKFFMVKLRTTTNAINYRGEKLPIIPGMTASVDILTGKKTVLEYLLKPIIKARQNALRER